MNCGLKANACVVCPGTQVCSAGVCTGAVDAGIPGPGEFGGGCSKTSDCDGLGGTTVIGKPFCKLAQLQIVSSLPGTDAGWLLADGAPFVSQADKNPTWTILALAWRTSDYITDQMKKRAL